MLTCNKYYYYFFFHISPHTFLGVIPILCPLFTLEIHVHNFRALITTNDVTDCCTLKF